MQLWKKNELYVRKVRKCQPIQWKNNKNRWINWIWQIGAMKFICLMNMQCADCDDTHVGFPKFLQSTVLAVGEIVKREKNMNVNTFSFHTSFHTVWHSKTVWANKQFGVCHRRNASRKRCSNYGIQSNALVGWSCYHIS